MLSGEDEKNITHLFLQRLLSRKVQDILIVHFRLVDDHKESQHKSLTRMGELIGHVMFQAGCWVIWPKRIQGMSEQDWDTGMNMS